MSKPIVAAAEPVKVTLEEGKRYFFCACGHSSRQPFCDGSHENTGLAPKAFVAEAAGDFFLCQCKKTGNPPYCDGSHMALQNDPKT